MQAWFKKSVSILVLSLFTVNTCFADIAGMGIEFSAKPETPQLIQIDIPAELASVEEFWEAPARPNPKMILQIQNAHTNYEAQSKIRDLMSYLNQNYGFKTIFVEGASEELNPDYLKLFPDAETNKKLWDELAKRGQITGADWFLLDDEKSGAKGVGIENAELYKKNYEALKAVYSRESETAKFVGGLESELDKLATKTLPTETRKIISEWKKFEKGHREFIPFVESLAKLAKQAINLDLKALYSQIEWPQMTRILVLQDMEAKLKGKAYNVQRTSPSDPAEKNGVRGTNDSVRVSAEVERLKMLDWLKKNGISKELISGLERFNEKDINMNRIRASSGKMESLPRFFVEKLVEEAGPKGLKFSDYPNFALYTGYLILRYEIEPTALFEEIRKLFDQLLDVNGKAYNVQRNQLSSEVDGGDARSTNDNVQIKSQSDLIELFRDAELIRKLLNLELSRGEWGTVLARKAEIEPARIFERVKNVAEGSKSPEQGAKTLTEYQMQIQTAFENAFSFYDFAIQRDDVFYEKMAKALETTDRAILMTGGFHTEGLREIFREKEISYGTITPRLTQVEKSNLYREVMLGKSSVRFFPNAGGRRSETKEADLEGSGSGLRTSGSNVEIRSLLDMAQIDLERARFSIEQIEESIRMVLAGKSFDGGRIAEHLNTYLFQNLTAEGGESFRIIYDNQNRRFEIAHSGPQVALEQVRDAMAQQDEAAKTQPSLPRTEMASSAVSADGKEEWGLTDPLNHDPRNFSYVVKFGPWVKNFLKEDGKIPRSRPYYSFSVITEKHKEIFLDGNIGLSFPVDKNDILVALKRMHEGIDIMGNRNDNELSQFVSRHRQKSASNVLYDKKTDGPFLLSPQKLVEKDDALDKDPNYAGNNEIIIGNYGQLKPNAIIYRIGGSSTLESVPNTLKSYFEHMPEIKSALDYGLPLIFIGDEGTNLSGLSKLVSSINPYLVEIRPGVFQDSEPFSRPKPLVPAGAAKSRSESRVEIVPAGYVKITSENPLDKGARLLDPETGRRYVVSTAGDWKTAKARPVWGRTEIPVEGLLHDIRYDPTIIQPNKYGILLGILAATAMTVSLATLLWVKHLSPPKAQDIQSVPASQEEVQPADDMEDEKPSKKIKQEEGGKKRQMDGPVLIASRSEARVKSKIIEVKANVEGLTGQRLGLYIDEGFESSLKKMQEGTVISIFGSVALAMLLKADGPLSKLSVKDFATDVDVYLEQGDRADVEKALAEYKPEIVGQTALSYLEKINFRISNLLLQVRVGENKELNFKVYGLAARGARANMRNMLSDLESRTLVDESEDGMFLTNAFRAIRMQLRFNLNVAEDLKDEVSLVLQEAREFGSDEYVDFVNSLLEDLFDFSKKKLDVDWNIAAGYLGAEAVEGFLRQKKASAASRDKLLAEQLLQSVFEINRSESRGPEAWVAEKSREAFVFSVRASGLVLGMAVDWLGGNYFTRNSMPLGERVERSISYYAGNWFGIRLLSSGPVADLDLKKMYFWSGVTAVGFVSVAAVAFTFLSSIPLVAIFLGVGVLIQLLPRAFKWVKNGLNLSKAGQVETVLPIAPFLKEDHGRASLIKAADQIFQQFKIQYFGHGTESEDSLDQILNPKDKEGTPLSKSFKPRLMQVKPGVNRADIGSAAGQFGPYDSGNGLFVQIRGESASGRDYIQDDFDAILFPIDRVAEMRQRFPGFAKMILSYEEFGQLIVWAAENKAKVEQYFEGQAVAEKEKKVFLNLLKRGGLVLEKSKWDKFVASARRLRLINGTESSDWYHADAVYDRKALVDQLISRGDFSKLAAARKPALASRSESRFLSTKNLVALSGLMTLVAIADFIALQGDKEQRNRPPRIAQVNGMGWSAEVPAGFTAAISDTGLALAGQRKGLVYVLANTNLFREINGRLVPNGLLRVAGEDLYSFNRNTKGLGEAKALFLIDVEGRMKIITAEAYLEDLKLPEELRLYSAEKFPYAFQAGPMVVENGKVNPGLGAWHKNVLNGKRSIIGFDSKGRFFRFDAEAPISFFGKFGKTKKGLQVAVEKWKEDNKIQWAMMTDGGNTGFSLLESAPPYALVFILKDFFSTAEGQKIVQEMGQQGLVEHLMNFAVDHRNALLMMMVVGALLSAMGAYFSYSQAKKKKQKTTLGLSRQRQLESLNRRAQEEVKRRQSLGLFDRRNIPRNQRRSEMRLLDVPQKDWPNPLKNAHQYFQNHLPNKTPGSWRVDSIGPMTIKSEVFEDDGKPSSVPWEFLAAEMGAQVHVYEAWPEMVDVNRDLISGRTDDASKRIIVEPSGNYQDARSGELADAIVMMSVSTVPGVEEAELRSLARAIVKNIHVNGLLILGAYRAGKDDGETLAHQKFIQFLKDEGLVFNKVPSLSASPEDFGFTDSDQGHNYDVLQVVSKPRSEMRIADGGLAAIEDSKRAKQEFEAAVSKGELIPQRANTSGANEAVIYEGSRGKWYAKQYNNPDQARAELLSWLIYRQLDIPVAQEMFVSEINGDVFLVSKMMPGDAVWNGYEDSALAAREFVASAFTQDRDRSKPDNYRKYQGQIYALDFGSSAMFRSNGEIKGEGEDQGAFSFSAENFLDMLSIESQHHSKSFFRNLSQDQINRQIAFVAERLTEDDLNQMINAAFIDESSIKEKISKVYEASANELDELAQRFEFAEDTTVPVIRLEAVKQPVLQRMIVALRNAWINFIRLFSHRKANHGDLQRFSAGTKSERVVPVLEALLTKQDASELISQRILEVNRFGSPQLTINPQQLAKWNDMPWYHGFDEAKLDSETGRPILEEIIFGENPGLRPSLVNGVNRPTVARDVRTAKNYVGKEGRDVILAFDAVKARSFLTDPFASIMNASAVVEDSYIPPSALTEDSKKYVISRYPDKTSDELAAALGVAKEWVEQVREDIWSGKIVFDEFGLTPALNAASARSEMRFDQDLVHQRFLENYGLNTEAAKRVGVDTSLKAWRTFTARWVYGLMAVPSEKENGLSVLQKRIDFYLNPQNQVSDFSKKKEMADWINQKVKAVFPNAVGLGPEQVVILKSSLKDENSPHGLAIRALGKIVFWEDQLDSQKRDLFEWTMVHESLHLIFPNLLGESLNEAVTEYLTGKILGRTPYEDGFEHDLLSAIALVAGEAAPEPDGPSSGYYSWFQGLTALFERFPGLEFAVVEAYQSGDYEKLKDMTTELSKDQLPKDFLFYVLINLDKFENNGRLLDVFLLSETIQMMLTYRHRLMILRNELAFDLGMQKASESSALKKIDDDINKINERLNGKDQTVGIFKGRFITTKDGEIYQNLTYDQEFRRLAERFNIELFEPVSRSEMRSLGEFRAAVKILTGKAITELDDIKVNGMSLETAFEKLQDLVTNWDGGYEVRISNQTETSSVRIELWKDGRLAQAKPSFNLQYQDLVVSIGQALRTQAPDLQMQPTLDGDANDYDDLKTVTFDIRKPPPSPAKESLARVLLQPFTATPEIKGPGMLFVNHVGQRTKDDTDDANQDRFMDFTVETKLGKATVLAVFDGHGQRGAEAAEQAQNLLKVELGNFLENVDTATLDDDWRAQIKSAFERVSLEMNKKGYLQSGTTASIAIVVGGRVVIISLGDSPIMVVNRNQPQNPISKKSTLNHIGDEASVIAMNSKLKESIGEDADDIDLMSRGWGLNGSYYSFPNGTQMKVLSALGHGDEPAVGIEPEVEFFNLESDGGYFLMVASDGILISASDDPKTSDDLNAKSISEAIKSGLSNKEVFDGLLARHRGTPMDNLTMYLANVGELTGRSEIRETWPASLKDLINLARNENTYLIPYVLDHFMLNMPHANPGDVHIGRIAGINVDVPLAKIKMIPRPGNNSYVTVLPSGIVIKSVSLASSSADFEGAENIIKEAISLKRLEKRGISESVPKIINMGWDEGTERFWIAFQGLENGIDLSDDIFTKGLSLDWKLHFMTQVAKLLGQMHQSEGSLLHRDLKPENIILKYPITGDWQLSDFGSAGKPEESVSGYTDVYIAPEADPRKTSNPLWGPAADIFSLGKTIAAIFQAHEQATGEAIPEELAALIAEMTREEISNRNPKTMSDVADQLEQILVGRSEMRKMPEAIWKRDKAPSEQIFLPGEEEAIKNRINQLRSLIEVAEKEGVAELVQLFNYPSFVLFFLGLKPAYLSTMKKSGAEPSISIVRDREGGVGLSNLPKDIKDIFDNQGIVVQKSGQFIYRPVDVANRLMTADSEGIIPEGFWTLADSKMLANIKEISPVNESKLNQIDFDLWLDDLFKRSAGDGRFSDYLYGVILGLPFESIKAFDDFVSQVPNVDVAGINFEPIGSQSLADISFAAKRVDGKFSDDVNLYAARYYDALSLFYSGAEGRFLSNEFFKYENQQGVTITQKFDVVERDVFEQATQTVRRFIFFVPSTNQADQPGQTYNLPPEYYFNSFIELVRQGDGGWQIMGARVDDGLGSLNLRDQGMLPWMLSRVLNDRRIQKVLPNVRNLPLLYVLKDRFGFEAETGNAAPVFWMKRLPQEAIGLKGFLSKPFLVEDKFKELLHLGDQKDLQFRGDIEILSSEELQKRIAEAKVIEYVPVPFGITLVRKARSEARSGFDNRAEPLRLERVARQLGWGERTSRSHASAWEMGVGLIGNHETKDQLKDLEEDSADVSGEQRNQFSDLINLKIQSYFGSNAFRVESDQIIFVKSSAISKYASGGVAAAYFDKGIMVVNENMLGEYDLDRVLVHETLHLLFPGFAQTNLNEAVTEFLTGEIMKAPIRERNREYYNYVKALENAVSLLGRDNPEELKRRILEAYRSGDLRIILNYLNQTRPNSAEGDFLMLMNAELFSDWGEWIAGFYPSEKSKGTLNYFKLLKKMADRFNEQAELNIQSGKDFMAGQEQLHEDYYLFRQILLKQLTDPQIVFAVKRNVVPFENQILEEKALQLAGRYNFEFARSEFRTITESAQRIEGNFETGNLAAVDRAVADKKVSVAAAILAGGVVGLAAESTEVGVLASVAAVAEFMAPARSESREQSILELIGAVSEDYGATVELLDKIPANFDDIANTLRANPQAVYAAVIQNTNDVDAAFIQEQYPELVGRFSLFAVGDQKIDIKMREAIEFVQPKKKGVVFAEFDSKVLVTGQVALLKSINFTENQPIKVLAYDDLLNANTGLIRYGKTILAAQKLRLEGAAGFVGALKGLVDKAEDWNGRGWAFKSDALNSLAEQIALQIQAAAQAAKSA